jgi:hypothetical protein
MDDFQFVTKIQQMLENKQIEYVVSYEDLSNLLELAWQYIDLVD